LYTSFPKNLCLINLDNVYKWIGFSRKDNAKRLLLNPIKLAPLTGGASFDEKNHGGHNVEQIMLTPNCFKKMCIKANCDTLQEALDLRDKTYKNVTGLDFSGANHNKIPINIGNKTFETKSEATKFIDKTINNLTQSI